MSGGVARKTLLLFGLIASQYQALRAEYVDWIDSRIRIGVSVTAINEELNKAGLIPRPAKTPDNDLVNHTGYLEPIATRNVRGTDDVVVIAALYKGAGCSLDMTAILYRVRLSQNSQASTARPRLRMLRSIFPGWTWARKTRSVPGCLPVVGSLRIAPPPGMGSGYGSISSANSLSTTFYRRM